MAWLHKFFKRDTCQEQPSASVPETAATNSPKPASTTVLQVVAEETIMSVAQWLVNLVNRSIQTNHIQTKPEVSETVESSTKVDDSPPISASPLMEELLSKFGRLIEQMSERDQQFIPLENRLRQVELAVVQTHEKEIEKKSELGQQFQKSLQLIDVLNQRLIKLEAQSEHAKNQAITTLAEATQPLEKRLQQVEVTLTQQHQQQHQLEKQLQESLQLLDRLHHRLDQVEAQAEQAQIPAFDSLPDILQPLTHCTQQVEIAFAQHHQLEQRLHESLHLIDRINERLDQMESPTPSASPQAEDTLTPTPESVDPSPGAIALFDDGMFQLAAETQQHDSTPEQIEQIHHSMAQLEERIENIEKLLAMFSIVPQLISENRQGIAALQHQLALNGNGKS